MKSTSRGFELLLSGYMSTKALYRLQNLRVIVTFERSRRTLAAGIILSVLGFAIVFIGLSMAADYQRDMHCCRYGDLCTLPEERCSVAETYYSIGSALIVTGFALLLSGTILLLLVYDYVKYTCPGCQTTKRTFTWLLAGKCPNCGLPIDRSK